MKWNQADLFDECQNVHVFFQSAARQRHIELPQPLLLTDGCAV